jgi:alkanesulfonate monooxygenase SsuD/methylene tetrahydromethanopterin reductase-like flavin-dependent oxidoreductase (luciferase family)
MFNYNQGRWGASQTELFDDLLAQIVLAEELGLEECWFTEHHFSDYSLLPSPNLVIAAAAQRTARMRFGNLVNVLPFHSPLRLAEETATLDQLSHGRIGFGVGRGIRRDEFERLQLPLAEAPAMFEEALSVVVKAWTEDHWSHEGRYWRYHDISLRPAPYQRPHPPIYVGANSTESVLWVAEHGYNLANHLSTLALAQDNVERYRAHYRGARPGEFVLAREIVIAESDAAARAAGQRAMQSFWHLFAQHALAPPAPPSDERLAEYTRHFRYLGERTHAALEADGIIITGAPDTVARRLREACATIRPDVLLGVFSFGGLSHAEVCRSLRLFAREVVPALRDVPAAPR